VENKNTILLFHPRTGHESNYTFFWAPYSLLSLATMLNEYDVKIIDNNLEADNYDKIIKKSIDDVLCVGISSMIGNQIKDGLNFANNIRKLDENIPIVWGGALPTILPEETLSSDLVDYVIRGQGEAKFSKLVNALAKNQQTKNIEGVGYRGHIPGIDKPEDKNSFPSYPFELIDFSKYIQSDPHVNTRTINYVSSQGCPFGCGFCSDTVLYQKSWTALSAKRSLEDITKLVDKYKVNGLKFYDSNFFVNSQRSKDFLNSIIDRNLGINWATSAHPLTLLKAKDDFYSLLSKSRLSRLLIGAESGVQEELDLVRKRIKVGDTLTVAKRLGDYDIIGSFTFIVGYPGMPESNISETIKYASKIRDMDARHEVKIHFYMPFPGTPLFERARQYGFNPPKTLDEWSNFDYYHIETPWVDKKSEPEVMRFNQENCPYVLGAGYEKKQPAK